MIPQSGATILKIAGAIFKIDDVLRSKTIERGVAERVQIL